MPERLPGLHTSDVGRKLGLGSCLVGERADVGRDGKKAVCSASPCTPETVSPIALPPGRTWIEYVIIAQGNRIRQYVNGVMTVDFTDEDPQLGAEERDRRAAAPRGQADVGGVQGRADQAVRREVNTRLAGVSR
jgi:hypothetical protein